MVENSKRLESSYNARKRVSEKLRVLMSGEQGSAFFDHVVHPHMVPEDIPSDLPDNVIWIGEKNRDSFEQSRSAMRDMLQSIVEFGDMHIKDAALCAESLDIDCFYETEIISLPCSKKIASKTTEQAAKILHMPQKNVVDPFGSTAIVYEFPKVENKLTEHTFEEAIVIPIRPEETGATIYDFRAS